MDTHHRIKLTIFDRQEIWRLWQTGDWKVSLLATRYHVSLPTIYKTLARARKQEFTPRRSVNVRFKTIQFGLKRLAKVEKELERQHKACRYQTFHSKKPIHFIMMQLPGLYRHS